MEGLKPLSPAEQGWVQEQLGHAVELARTYTGESEAVPSPARMDDALVAWSRSDDVSKPDASGFAHTFGCALGAHLAEALGVSWVIATHEDGADLALHGQPGDVLIFPTVTVARWLEATKPLQPFLQDLFESTVEEVRRSRAAAD